MIAGAISFGEGFDAKSVAHAVALRTNRYGTLKINTLVEEKGFSVLSLTREKQEHVEDILTTSGMHLIGDLNYCPETVGLALEDLKEDGAFPSRLKGRHIGVRYLPEKSAIQLTTDYLGTAWLFIGKTSGGYVFGSDFGAVAEQMRGQLSINKERALIELLLGSFADDESVFNEITLAPPNAVVSLGSDRSYEVSRTLPEYGSRFTDAAEKKKFEALDEIFNNIAANLSRNHKYRLLLSLSTGYDSRYGLALLTKNGFEFDCLTFGHPDSLEVFGAMRVARNAGVATEVFPQPDGNWNNWYDLTTATGTSGTVQWCGWCQDWARHLAAHGDSVMIGYLGDAMSGVRLNFDTEDQAHWLSSWIVRWGQWNALEPHSAPAFIQEKLRKAAFEIAHSRAESSLAGVKFEQPHQQAQYLNLYGRQRRHVASQAHLLNYFISPLTYLYDRELLDFSANVSITDLDDQRLYLRYAHSRFPDLFTGENKQVHLSMMERVRSKIGSTARKLSGGTKPRPSVIDRNRIIVPNIEEIVKLTERVDPVSCEIIDTERFCEEVRNYSNESYDRSASIIMTTNLLQLFDIAT